MKLFQQMLVAGATLSLLAPVAAQASNVINLEEMKSYSRSKTKSSRLDSKTFINEVSEDIACLLYTSPSPRDSSKSRMPSSA